MYGDWRELFRQIERIDAVSKADLRRVANKIFTPENRTVALMETAKPQPDGAAQPKGGQQ
jgi:predicted Zn-dependent peptidase